jgi:hypothetical protein
MNKARLILVTLAAAAVTTSASGAADTKGPSPLLSALQACHSIADAAQKLACFERASQALISAEEKGEIAVVHQKQVQEVRRSLFGFSVPKFPFFSKRDDKEDDEPREIISSLRSFNSIGNGRYRVQIADASAVWETTESSMLRDPKPGDKVTIKGGVMGSYFMQIGTQRWVRARRVR